MPYSNIGNRPKLTAKMDRCVQDIMRKDPTKTKEAAIRICYSSIIKKDLGEGAMNKTQKKAQLRSKREAARLRRLQKQAELEQAQEDELEEEIASEEEDEGIGEEEQVLQKDGMVIGSSEEAQKVQMIVGPTSWDELDQRRMEAERAQEMRKVTWDVQDLVANILESPVLELTDKSKAVQEVGKGFEQRVTALMAAKDEQEIEAIEFEKDLDLLGIEAILAHDKRERNLLESMTDILTKAKLTAAAEGNLADEAFALVVMRDGKKVRKYPIHDKAHVRNALARAAQQLQAGGEGAADAKAALPKIRAAAKRMGIEVGMKKERNAILIEKDFNDQWRWVGWVSNNFLDWNGQIVSEAAHREYVEFFEKNKDAAPIFLTWHTPGTGRKAPVDFCTYENGFLIMSGKLEEAEAVALLKAREKTELGMSFGALGLVVPGKTTRGPEIVIKYRMYEVSDLPLENAANPFTDFETIVKEVGMDKTKYLTLLLGSEEKATQFLEKTKLKQEELRAAQIPEKEKQPDPPEPKTGDPAGGTQAAPISPEDAQAIVARVFKEMDIEGLNAFVVQAKEAIEKVPVLEALVKELQGNQDEKLAELLTPPATRFAWMQAERASQAKETIIKKDDKLAKKTPGVPEDYWLSEVTATAPVTAEQQ